MLFKILSTMLRDCIAGLVVCLARFACKVNEVKCDVK